MHWWFLGVCAAHNMWFCVDMTHHMSLFCEAALRVLFLYLREGFISIFSPQPREESEWDWLLAGCRRHCSVPTQSTHVCEWEARGLSLLYYTGARCLFIFTGGGSLVRFVSQCGSVNFQYAHSMPNGICDFEVLFWAGCEKCLYNNCSRWEIILAGLAIVAQIAEEKPASGFFFHFDCKDFSVYERRGKNGGSSSN